MRWVRVGLACIAGLVLTALALWASAYFFLGSSAGQALLLPLIPRGATVGRVIWGPLPDTVRATDIHYQGRALSLDVRALEARLALPAFELASVALDIERVTFDATLPSPPVVATPAGTPSTATPTTPKPRIIPAITARVGEIWVLTDSLQAHVQGAKVATAGGRLETAATGATPAGLAVTAETGACDVSLGHGRRVLGWSACAFAVTVRDLGKDLTLTHLSLVDGARLALVASGHASLTGERPKAELTLELASSRLEAEAMVGRLLPWGFEAQGVTLAFDKGMVDGKVGAVHAAGLAAAAVQLTDVSFALPHIAVAPGLLIPAIDADARSLYVARAEGLGWTLTHLSFGRFLGSIEKKLEGFAEAGLVDDWQIAAPTDPDAGPGLGASAPTDLGPIRLDASLVLGLAGGTIAADLATTHGELGVRGRIKTSPITKRTSFTTELAFARLEAPLADLLAHDLPADERTKLGAPLAGKATFALDVEREADDDGVLQWVTDLAWDATTLRGPGPDKSTPMVVHWDGSTWTVLNPEAPDPDDNDDAPPPEPPPQKDGP